MAMETSKVKTPSFWQEAWALVTNPIYMLSVLGYAAYSAVTAGVANFGPFLLIHLVGGWGELCFLWEYSHFVLYAGIVQQ